MKHEYGYLDPLRVESINAKEWLYLERFRLQGSEGDIFEIEAGETTDFATVPFWSQIVLPRTGTWTKAAGVHDKMCKQLNEYYKRMKQYEDLVAGWRMLNDISGLNQPLPEPPVKPLFNSIDTDAVFRKNARMEGTDPIRAELLWLGVRYGALRNPARREDWHKTARRVAVDTAASLAVVGLFITIVSKVWPW